MQEDKMIHNKSLKKELSVIIVILFISLVVKPTINFSVVKASNDNDLVEVTSQACGIQGFGNTTVKLTKQQYQNLEQYLVDFRARLNQTTTREEAVPLFKEAVVELNKYGLLPKGMSIKQAQNLVIGRDKEENHSILYQRLHRIVSNINLTDYNFLCLITGSITNMTVLGLLNTLIAVIIMDPFFLIYLLSAFNYLLGGGKWSYFVACVSHLIVQLILESWVLFNRFLNYLPISLGFRVFFENASGWVKSIGLLGSKSWNGSLDNALQDMNNIWWAMYGFTGLKIFTGFSKPDFLLGTALAVGIQET
jgi:hypothetical protein